MPNPENLSVQHTQAAFAQNDHVVQAGIYQGPLPPPAILEGYAHLDASFPERIMREFEANSEHIRNMNIMAQEAEVSRDKRAQWMAFSLTFFLLLVIVYAIYKESTVIAGFGSLAFLGLLIKSFVVKTPVQK